MIEANELRVGNFISNDRIVNTIENILSAGICTLKTPQGNYIKARYELIKPIILTDEWLIRFGFEMRKGEYQIARYNIYKPVDYVGYLFCEGNLILRELKCVHTLQNLYFALIGEELEIK